MTIHPLMAEAARAATLPARFYLRWCEDFWGTWLSVYAPGGIGKQARE